jgi:hypothetical protein
MSFFRKKSKEVVDLTKLRESGVFQRSQEIASRRKDNSSSSDVVDLSSSSSVPTEVIPDSGGNDFLSALAGAGSTSVNSNATESRVVSRLKSARESNVGSVNAMKNKLEDMEYKFDRLMERLARIESKLDL